MNHTHTHTLTTDCLKYTEELFVLFCLSHLPSLLKGEAGRRSATSFYSFPSLSLQFIHPLYMTRIDRRKRRRRDPEEQYKVPHSFPFSLLGKYGDKMCVCVCFKARQSPSPHQHITPVINHEERADFRAHQKHIRQLIHNFVKVNVFVVSRGIFCGGGHPAPAGWVT